MGRTKPPTISMSACSDPAILELAIEGCKQLLADPQKARTAIVVLTSACRFEDHGNHVTAVVLNRTGPLSPSEARLAVRRLRSLADELEQQFAPPGSAN